MEQTGGVQTRWQPRSNLARAVLPVVGGLAFFALLGLLTWGIASLLSRNPEQVEERLAETQFEVGNTEFLSDLIADDGPLLFQGLVGDSADRLAALFPVMRLAAWLPVPCRGDVPVSVRFSTKPYSVHEVLERISSVP